MKQSSFILFIFNSLLSAGQKSPVFDNVRFDSSYTLIALSSSFHDLNTYSKAYCFLVDNIRATAIKLTEKISIRKEYLIEDAIKRSASVSKGKIIEHFAPFMLSNIFNPDEMVFIGSPIDLISFKNIDTKEDISIDFLEIKTGNSSLNKKQKLIKEAILYKRVYFKTVHL